MSDPMRRSFLRTFGRTPQSIRNALSFPAVRETPDLRDFSLSQIVGGEGSVSFRSGTGRTPSPQSQTRWAADIRIARSVSFKESCCWNVTPQVRNFA
jgi:hypothetical protein